MASGPAENGGGPLLFLGGGGGGEKGARGGDQPEGFFPTHPAPSRPAIPSGGGGVGEPAVGPASRRSRPAPDRRDAGPTRQMKMEAPLAPILAGTAPRAPVSEHGVGRRPMDYVNLGKSGLKVSRLCLGCMTYGV